MLSLDFAELIEEGLTLSKRKPDGLLHCSQDLDGSLRHAQLRLAGAPARPEPIASQIRLMTGTLWHRYVGEIFEQTQKVPVMLEVKVVDGLPKGWSGTADMITWDADHQAYVLRDVKTMRAEAFTYTDGMKRDHRLQLSAYYYALVNMGYPMVREFEVVYLPLNALAGDETQIRVEAALPVSHAELWLEMEDRWEQTEAYLHSLPIELDDDAYLTDKLAPGLEREQKAYKEKDGTYTLKLMPHWRTRYCPYDPPLCDCKLQGQTKIGTYHPVGHRWMYEPRKGYEDVEPVVAPEGGVISV